MLRWSSTFFLAVLGACSGLPEVGQPDSGGGGGGGGAGQTVDLPCEVAEVVSSTCLSCHGSPLAHAAPFPLLRRSDFSAPSPSVPGSTVAERSLARMQAAMNPMPPPYFTPHPTAAQVTAFATWVDAGLPQGSCSSTGVPDAGPPMLTCTSGTFWTLGNTESAAMNPGLACKICHSTQAPVRDYAFMGTLYPSLHEKDACNATGIPPGTRIEILDAQGTVRVTMTPNAVGNFRSTSRQPPFTGPYRARVVNGTKSIEMVTPQTSGDCNLCHTDYGNNGAPGRVIVP